MTPRSLSLILTLAPALAAQAQTLAEVAARAADS